MNAVRSALERLQALTFGAYARADISNVVDPLGSRVESFLRAIVFPTSTRSDNFYRLIERLATNGLAAADVQRIHNLRDLYNTSKHAPTTLLVLADAIAVCERALAALRAVVQLGIGTVDTPFERDLNYYLYVAFWDHFHSGDTEAAVMVPSDHWLHVSAVDVFHLDIRSWDKLKQLLVAHPRFRLGKEHFRPEVWKGFVEESTDFLNAGVWQGDYGELARLLADFEDRGIAKALLPTSSRNYNTISVATALTIAAVDIVRAATASMDSWQIVRAMIARADAEYAMPADSAKIPRAAAQISALIVALPFERWRYLTGPALTPYQARSWPEGSDGPLAIALDGNTIVLGI